MNNNFDGRKIHTETETTEDTLRKISKKINSNVFKYKTYVIYSLKATS